MTSEQWSKISKKVKANEKNIDHLEQCSKSNCLILHGCPYAPIGALVSNQGFEDFVLVFLKSKLNRLPAVIYSDIDIYYALLSNKGKNPIDGKFVRRTVRNKGASRNLLREEGARI